MNRQKEKALELLARLGVGERETSEFRENNSATCFFPLFSHLLSCDCNVVEKIVEIEKKYDVLVYAAIYEEFSFGRTLNFLIVGNDPEEWDMLMRGDSEIYAVYAYVWNLTKEEYSEFGYITVKNDNGSLRRIL